MKEFDKFMDYLRHTDCKDYEWGTISKLSYRARVEMVLLIEKNKELESRVEDLETGNIRYAAI